MWSSRFAISPSLIWVLIGSTGAIMSVVPLQARVYASVSSAIQKVDPRTSASAVTTPSRMVLKRVPAKYPSEVSTTVLGAYFTVSFTVSSTGDVSAVQISDWSITNTKGSRAGRAIGRVTVPTSAEIVSGREAVRLFTEAAKTAALQWRFARADTESTEEVAFAFAASSGGGVLGKFVRSVIPSAITDRIAAWYWPNTAPARSGGAILPPEKIVDVHPMYPGRRGELKVSDAV